MPPGLSWSGNVRKLVAVKFLVIFFKKVQRNSVLVEYG